MTNEFFDAETVKQIIADYCRENQISEKAFAALISVHPAHLPRIKKGLMGSNETLAKIAILGGIEFKDLIKQNPPRLIEELRLVGQQNNTVAPA